ncbi:unnamed protein product, partial [Meganyctiphanes norvegica]
KECHTLAFTSSFRDVRRKLADTGDAPNLNVSSHEQNVSDIEQIIVDNKKDFNTAVYESNYANSTFLLINEIVDKLRQRGDQINEIDDKLSQMSVSLAAALKTSF